MSFKPLHVITSISLVSPMHSRVQQSYSQRINKTTGSTSKLLTSSIVMSPIVTRALHQEPRNTTTLMAKPRISITVPEPGSFRSCRVRLGVDDGGDEILTKRASVCHALVLYSRVWIVLQCPCFRILSAVMSFLKDKSTSENVW